MNLRSRTFRSLLSPSPSVGIKYQANNYCFWPHERKGTLASISHSPPFLRSNLAVPRRLSSSMVEAAVTESGPSHANKEKDVPQHFLAMDKYGWDPDETECTLLYRPGGLHFVRINERLNDRYRVLMKLGYGSYSTTWLARDETNQRLVAVKVSISDPVTKHEAKTLQVLGTAFEAQGHRCTELIPKVLDSFQVHGANGRHPCYVRALAKTAMIFPQGGKPNNSDLFELDIARSLATQVAMAVAYLHSQGYIHGGEPNRRQASSTSVFR